MAKEHPPRRDLKFENLDAMLAEAQSLQSTGYKSNSNWNLGQTTSHIADWMRYPVDGFPKPPFFMVPFFWLMKVTIMPGLKKKILAEGFKPGTPTAPQSVAQADEYSDEQGVAKLQETVDRIVGYDGELHPSPLFGPMDKETLIKVTLLHAEHHLGFLEPNS